MDPPIVLTVSRFFLFFLRSKIDTTVLKCQTKNITSKYFGILGQFFYLGRHSGKSCVEKCRPCSDRGNIQRRYRQDRQVTLQTSRWKLQLFSKTEQPIRRRLRGKLHKRQHRGKTSAMKFRSHHHGWKVHSRWRIFLHLEVVTQQAG